MGRSLCYCEPQFTHAGETNNWNFHYSPSTDLEKGTLLRFDLCSWGRAFEWQLPNLEDPTNTLFLTLSNNKKLKAKEIELDNGKIQYEFQLPSLIKEGTELVITLGSGGKKASTNHAQTFTQRKKQFHLYIDSKGKNEFKEHELFQMDIRGNKLQNLKVLTPSFVSRNRRFDVIIRFEDDFGNLTSNAPDETLIELSYENLRENLNWKLFVPETGFLTLPNLYFNEAGVYRIQLKNLHTNKIYYSAPIKCFEESNLNLFWGLLHGESIRFNAKEEIDCYLRQMRDDKALQFIAASPFDSEQEISNEEWKDLAQSIAEFNEDERFTAFLGFQWLGDLKEEGLRQFIYSKDNKPILRKKDLKNNSLKKIYKTSSTKDLMSIPTFTMGENATYDFSNYSYEFERVVEIYNAWGSSECTKKEGNLRPITPDTKKGIKEKKEGSIREALKNNCRFGFIAGGLDDRGIYENFYENQVQYSPGLTAIISENQSRESIYDALYNRRCYATTGERIVMNFYIANEMMGSEINTQKKPGLAFNRHITGFVLGTEKIQKITVFRNGELFKEFTPNEYQFNFAFDDSEPLSKIVIKKNDHSPFVFYYIRVLQENGEIAWSSPIWIDLLNEKIIKKKKV